MLGKNSPFKLCPTGLAMKRKPTRKEWMRDGDRIREVIEACQWWAVDWLNIGESMFGEEASQAIDVADWSEETLRIYRYVGQRVPPRNRMQTVPFTFHYVVAPLEVGKQRAWLERAKTNNWTRERLRQEIAGSMEGGKEQVWVLIDAKNRDDAQKLLDRLNLEGRNGKIVSKTSKKMKEAA